MWHQKERGMMGFVSTEGWGAIEISILPTQRTSNMYAHCISTTFDLCMMILITIVGTPLS